MVGSDRPSPDAGSEQSGINFNLLAAKDPHAPVYKPGQTTQETFTIDGQERSAQVHLPSNWDGKTALPTLYYLKALHPGDPEPESFTGLSAKADKAGVAIVYLTGEGSMLHGWNNGQR
jgi:poly(3-hydroxybutyrate) depolymerase